MIGRRANAFDVLNTLLLVLLALVTLYPFWNVLVVSFSTDEAYFRDWYHVVPRSFSLKSYTYNFGNIRTVRAFGVSVFITVTGTIAAVTITSMAAFVLSKTFLRLRKPLFMLFITTMFFHGGLIPLWLVVDRLGMRNTLFALFVPTLLSTYYLILMKNYFTDMPESMEESARIDGANDFTILFRIVMPSAKPIVVTISLFYAVQFWNDWYNSLIYLTRRELYPLSYYLRELISSDIVGDTLNVMQVQVPAMIRAAAIVITILPIMLVYPFIQKHFVKGILLGSTKG
jgi:putative aldouronate transport system permease protein